MSNLESPLVLPVMYIARVMILYFLYISPCPHKVGSIIIPILQMWELRLREVKGLA